MKTATTFPFLDLPFTALTPKNLRKHKKYDIRWRRTLKMDWKLFIHIKEIIKKRKFTQSFQYTNYLPSKESSSLFILSLDDPWKMETTGGDVININLKNKDLSAPRLNEDDNKKKNPRNVYYLKLKYFEINII